MKEIALKPCPFCGGEAFISDDGDIKSTVFCDNCGSSSGYGLISDVVIAWNKRANIPAPVQKLKNERGAGRKPISKEVKDQIIKYGKFLPIRHLATKFNVSVGTVHKIIHEHSPVKPEKRAYRKMFKN